MADRATWAERVAGWRTSELTSEQFSAGQGFTAGALRKAAQELDSGTRASKAQTIRVARVLRAPAASAAAALVVELGDARVIVHAGVDRATLATVFDVLTARAGAA